MYDLYKNTAQPANTLARFSEEKARSAPFKVADSSEVADGIAEGNAVFAEFIEALAPMSLPLRNLNKAVGNKYLYLIKKLFYYK